MGKKKAGVRSPTVSVNYDEGVVTEVGKLKEEGNRLFGRKEYSNALDAYERASKITAADAKEERALLHSNKAACHLMLQRHKEAINECTAALEAVPAYHKALVRRSKAHEAMGHFKQALSDIKEANRADTANPDTQEAEKRLRDVVAGKRPAGGLVAANAARGRGGVAKSGRQPMLVFTAKCTLDDETRVLHILGHTGYAELLDHMRQKFRGAGPFVIKYLDRHGDLVTMTDKQDVAAALAEVVEAAERAAPPQHASPQRMTLQHLVALTPLRLHLVRVASEDDVPQPPPEEVAALAQIQEVRRQLQAQQQQQQLKKAEPEGQPEGQFEPDQWLIDFAGLFRDHLGVEPDRHLDLLSMGWDKLQAALDASVQDDKAVELFDAAAARFQEVSAQGLVQWGNVFMCQAKRVLDRAALAGTPVEDVAGDVEAWFAKAEGRYNESLRIKGDHYDSFASLGNLQFERAKLEAGLVVFQPTPAKAEGGDKAAEEAAAEKTQAEQTEALRAALAKLQPEKVDAAAGTFASVWRRFEEALDKVPEAERNKPLKPVQEGAEPENENNPWAHLLIMWGNLLYEHSQILAAVEREWRPALDSATSKFRAAGCPEADIRNALGAHSRASELDLPPLEESAKEAKPSAATTPNGKPAASPLVEPDTPPQKPAPSKPPSVEEGPKGLPSLGPRPKKKTIEAQPKKPETIAV